MKTPSTRHASAIRRKPKLVISQEFQTLLFQLLTTGMLALACCVLVGGSAAAQQLNVVYTFGSVITTDLLYPNASLTADTAGNFYSIASQGGNGGEGGIFELSPPAAKGGAWTYAPIYLFSGSSDGGQPIGDLVIDANGVLYGVTQFGGESTQGGYGVVYQLAPPAVLGGAWTENVLYTFTDGDDGGYPRAGLAFDKVGNLYGTTYSAGSLGGGVVFELSPPAVSGGAWTYNVISSFDVTKKSPGGCGPQAGLLPNYTGGLYGTSTSCGTNGGGVAFLLTPPTNGQGAWTETVIHTFGFATGKGDGSVPFAAMVSGPKGVLFGATSGGGTSGDGTVYELVPPATKGNAWTENVLYSFGSGATDPLGRLTLTSTGLLYGTLTSDATGQGGGVFKLTPPAVSGDPWTETTLEAFSETGSGPSTPEGGLLLKNGALYSTSLFGGPNNSGTVFKLIP